MSHSWDRRSPGAGNDGLQASADQFLSMCFLCGQVMALTPALDLPSEILITPGLPLAAPSIRPSQTVQLLSYCRKYMVATPSRLALEHVLSTE